MGLPYGWLTGRKLGNWEDLPDFMRVATFRLHEIHVGWVPSIRRGLVSAAKVGTDLCP